MSPTVAESLRRLDEQEAGRQAEGLRIQETQRRQKELEERARITKEQDEKARILEAQKQMRKTLDIVEPYMHEALGLVTGTRKKDLVRRDFNMSLVYGDNYKIKDNKDYDGIGTGLDYENGRIDCVEVIVDPRSDGSLVINNHTISKEELQLNPNAITDALASALRHPHEEHLKKGERHGGVSGGGGPTQY